MRRATLLTLAAPAVLAADLLVANLACAPKPPPPAAVPAAPLPAVAVTRPAGKPAGHWVQAPQLRAVMQRVSAAATAGWPKTLPSDVESPADPSAMDRSYEAAAQLADALSASARRIPDAIAGKTMSDDVRTGFLAEASILRTQAEQLGTEARARRAESMARTLDQINATCVTCHSRYRDLAGTLDFPRAMGEGVRGRGVGL
ncbi:MAG TPA: hypothetical protein VF796_15875 [Humisphaera sp.]